MNNHSWLFWHLYCFRQLGDWGGGGECDGERSWPIPSYFIASLGQLRSMKNYVTQGYNMADIKRDLTKWRHKFLI